MSKNKTLSISNRCVACGVCTKVCPLSALSVYKGLYATVNREKCVCCGKCTIACPTDCITVLTKEVTV